LGTFTFEFKVYLVETDALRVVHYTNYFRYCERAEEELFHTLGLEFPFSTEYGVWFPRVEASCKYLSSCRYHDVLRVSVNLEELKEKAYRLGFTIYNLTTGRRAAECHVTAVSVDSQGGRAVPIPGKYANAILSFFGGDTS
jgi:acyl-CoA thioester hydrolase